MATHSRILAWRIPGTEEPGGLPSMGLHRVRHDWATSLHSLHTLSLEKEMSTHSRILAWRILWTERPGGPRSTGSQRVRHDWSDWACTRTHQGSKCLLKETNLPKRYTQRRKPLERALGFQQKGSWWGEIWGLRLSVGWSPQWSLRKKDNIWIL